MNPDLTSIEQKALQYLAQLNPSTKKTTPLGHFPNLWKFIKAETSSLSDPTYLPTVDRLLSQEPASQSVTRTALSRRKQEKAETIPPSRRVFPSTIPNPIRVVDLHTPGALHIFIDNSNIFHGAQKLLSTLTTNQYASVRLHYPRLFLLLSDNQSVAKQVIIASAPLIQPVHPHADHYGYESHILHRVLKRSTKVEKGKPRQALLEQCVDELLNSKMSDSLLDCEPSTLVLATGDGGDAEYGFGFIRNVERALLRGWNVKLYSWGHQLSSLYKEKFANHPRFKIVLLDRFLFQLTWVSPLKLEGSKKRFCGNFSA